MVVVMRNESLCPGTNALIEGFGDGLVWNKKSDAMRMEGGDSVVFDECEGVNDG